MALITIDPPADQSVLAANQIRKIAQDIFEFLLPKYVLAYNTYWKNPRATPVQISAQLGTDAAELFVLSGQLATLLATAGATGIPLTVPPGYTVTVNADKTVNVIKG